MSLFRHIDSHPDAQLERFGFLETPSTVHLGWLVSTLLYVGVVGRLISTRLFRDAESDGVLSRDAAGEKIMVGLGGTRSAYNFTMVQLVARVLLMHREWK